MANITQTPTELIVPGFDLQVAFRRNGAWDYDWTDSRVAPRLRVESASVGLNRDMPRAELTLDLSGSFDDDGNAVDPQLTMAELYGLVELQSEVLIYAGDGDDRRFLFHGHFSLDTLKFDPRSLAMDITCTSRLEWLGRQRAAWIVGRIILNRGLTPARLAAVYAYECVFNKDGKPNRHPDLQTRETTQKVPIFADDDAPGAKYWSYADILRYLLVVYLRDVADSRINTDHLLAMTDGLTGLDPLDEVPGGLMTLQEVLKCKADPLAVNGLSVVRALLAWCESSGCSLHQWTCNDNAGAPDTRLFVHLNREAGPYRTFGDAASERLIREDLAVAGLDARPLHMAKEGYNFAAASPVEIHELNDVFQGELLRDAKNMINSCRIFGMPELYEVTIGKGGGRDTFLPGWKPDTMFGDNLSSTVMSKIAETTRAKDANASGNAGTMFKRYNGNGEDHASYLQVGRIWVLNEALELTAADYAHSNNGTTQWNQAAYEAAYDWNGCAVGKAMDAVGARVYSWVTRRRRILPNITKNADGSRIGALVECSFNGGTKWYPYPGNCHFLDDRIGVVLTDPDLAEVKNKGKRSEDSSAGRSVWEAIVRGDFRIAVTCCVESDELTQGTFESQAAVGQGKYHADVHTHRALRLESIDSNSELKSKTGLVAATLDESTRAKSVAKLFVDSEQARRFSGTLVIPRLTDAWRPGDQVSGLQPRNLQFLATMGAKGYPQIVRVLWVSTRNNQTTHLTLGDDRLEVRKVKGSAGGDVSIS